MILDELAESARVRVAADKRAIPQDSMEETARGLGRAGYRDGQGPFARALRGSESAFICEIKKASPSKGVIDPVFDYEAIADAYVSAGADCLSVLTEPTRFLGSDDIFRAVRARTNLPLLRKDFTVDPYQIFQAKTMGADAVLIIMALHDSASAKTLITLAGELGLDALVECHTQEEIDRAQDVGATIIGINNRNLVNFVVDTDTTSKLAKSVTEDVLLVAESGVASPADVAVFVAAGARGVLVGEFLMRAKDKTAALESLRREGAGAYDNR